MRLPLKRFQEELLDALEAFLARCRERGEPTAAFAEATREHFGFALPYHPLPGAEAVPYVCLRVPTGGGKTRLAAHAIGRATRAFMPTPHALVLWLVPSEPIREQTLAALRTRGSMLNEDLRTLYGGAHVLDVNEALHLQPATLATGHTIVVATMQSFKRDAAEGLRVYRQNGALMPHFEGLPRSLRGEHSLADVIRLRRPLVIVDEAHNQGTPLAVDTLARLHPACVLELTATPDRAHQPSNVLRSVSAATLQAEDMLKLPLELAIHPEWRVSLAEAIARLRQLEQAAEAERQRTGEQIRPVVMLIQAERKLAGQETLTPERVKKALVEDFQIPEAAVAISTGAVDELEGKRLGEADYPQFIITVDKLREGWDCPNAYVLFSLRSTTSATAVEQVLGRVLRMPGAKRKTEEALNRSYAYVVSAELAATVQGLRDGLVQNGFERLDARELIRTAHEAATAQHDLFVPQEGVAIALPEVQQSLALPDAQALAELPKALRERVEVSPESGVLWIKGGVTAQQARLVAQTFREPEAQEQVRQRLSEALAAQAHAAPRSPTPAEQGQRVHVPLLAYGQRGFFDVFDATPLLEADWEITDFDARLSEAEFAHDVQAMRRASLSISQLETVACEVYDRMDSQLALFAFEPGWTLQDLAYWLDRNLPFPYSERDLKVAWILKALEVLVQERGFAVEELAYRKFRLRAALQRKLAAGLTLAKQRVLDALFADESAFALRDEHSVVLEQGRYAYDFPYTGLLPLGRHFFPVIGNLKPSGEEFECAAYIANEAPGVQWWVRNVERKPTSFWLQTSADRFYPDFLVQLQSGVLVAVEYKGEHIAHSRESVEKRRVGELWARQSQGRCRFAWVQDRDWNRLAQALA